MIKRLLVVGLVVISLMAVSVSTAFAAQGQITEVNPSGIGVAAGKNDVVVPVLRGALGADAFDGLLQKDIVIGGISD